VLGPSFSKNKQRIVGKKRKDREKEARAVRKQVHFGGDKQKGPRQPQERLAAGEGGGGLVELGGDLHGDFAGGL
jgi:hypothetical protein